MADFFTEEQLQNFKSGSLPFPMFFCGKDTLNVVEVFEVVSISGMAQNNGTPTEITIMRRTPAGNNECLNYKLEGK